MNMDTNQKWQYFNKYFPSDNRSSGIIREIKKEIEEGEKITKLETKHRELFGLKNKHEANLDHLTKIFKFLRLKSIYINKEETIDKYSEQIDKLKKIEEET